MTARDDLMKYVEREATFDQQVFAGHLDALVAEHLRDAARFMAASNPDHDPDFSEGVDWAVALLERLAKDSEKPAEAQPVKQRNGMDPWLILGANPDAQHRPGYVDIDTPGPTL